ncbi:MAG: type II toxin-antitoxin system RelE/ParE family toxin [bacterium]
MVKLKWTPKARGHLRSIYEYISRDSVPYARRHIERLVTATEKISQFPEVGRVVSELTEYGLREIIFQNYRIVYRYLQKERIVQILSVLHCARDIEKIPIEENENPI